MGGYFVPTCIVYTIRIVYARGILEDLTEIVKLWQAQGCGAKINKVSSVHKGEFSMVDEKLNWTIED